MPNIRLETDLGTRSQGSRGPELLSLRVMRRFTSEQSRGTGAVR